MRMMEKLNRRGSVLRATLVWAGEDGGLVGEVAVNSSLHLATTRNKNKKTGRQK
jgi:hypothetical protein